MLGCLKENPLLLAVAVLPAAAAVAVYRACYRHGHAPIPTAGLRALQKSPQDWSTADVEVWISSLGDISVHGVIAAKCKEHGVDGAVLLHLKERNLKQLGITSLGDQVRFLRHLAKLQQQVGIPTSFSERDEEPTPAHHGHLTADALPPSTATAERGSSASEAAASIHFITETVKHTFQLLASDAFKQAEPQRQRKLFAQIQEVLPAIEQRFASLPTTHQEIIKPIVSEMQQVCSRISDVLARSEVSPASAAASRPRAEIPDEDDGVEDVAPAAIPAATAGVSSADIAARLRRWSAVLKSSTFTKADAATRGQFLTQIIRETGNIKGHIIPTAAAREQPVLAALADQLIADAREAAESEKATPPVQRATVSHILNRLKAIFETIRSPSLMDDPDLASRKDRIAAMTDDVNGLLAEAEHLPEDEKRHVLQLGEQIAQLLTRLSAITVQQQSIEANAAGLSSRTAQPEPQEGGLPVILTALRSVLGVLKSTDFAGLAPAGQREVLQLLRQKMQSATSAADRLPKQERESAMAAVQQVASLLDGVEGTLSAQPPAKSEAPPFGVRPTSGRGGVPVPSPTKSGAAAAPPPPAAPAAPMSESLTIILQQFKEVEAVLDAPAFKGAPKPKQLEIVHSLQEHLTKLIPIMQRLHRGDVTIAGERAKALSNRLQTLGTRIVDELAESGHTGEADDEAANQDDEDEDEGEEEGDADANAAADTEGGVWAGPYKEVTNRLASIDRALDSDQFRTARLESKYEFVEGIHAALVKIVEVVEHLPPKAQAAAMERVSKVHEHVREVVAKLSSEVDELDNNNAAGDSEQARMQAELTTNEASAASAAKTMKILDKLQNIFAVLTSDVLRDSGAEQRLTICSTVQRELKLLLQDASTLQPDQQESVMPLLQRAAKTVDALLKLPDDESDDRANGKADDDGDDDDEGENDDDDDNNEGAPASDDERKVVFDSASQLTEILKDGGVSLEALKLAVNLLRQMGSFNPLSAKEKSIRAQMEKTVSEKLAALRASKPDGGKPQDAPRQTPSSDRAKGAAAAAAPPSPFSTQVQAITMELRNAHATTRQDLKPFLERFSKLVANEGGEWRTDAVKVDLVKRFIQAYEERQQEIAASEAGRHDAAAGNDCDDQNEEGEKEEAEEEEEEEEQADEQGGKARRDVGAETPLVKALEEAAASVSPQSFGNPTVMNPVLTLLQTCIENRSRLSVRELRAAEALRQKILASRSGSDAAAPNASEDREKVIEREAMRVLREAHSLPDQPSVTEVTTVTRAISQLQSLGSLSGKARAAVTEAERIVENRLDNIRNSVKDKPQFAEVPEPSTPSTPGTPGLPESVIADIELLPRINERLKSENFVSHCSHFELQCIGAIMARLTDSPAVHRSAELRRAVASAIELFSKRTSKLDRSKLKSAEESRATLNLTALVSEASSGVPVLRYVFVSPEENDEGYDTDAALMTRLRESFQATALPSADLVLAASHRSEALLINVRRYSDGSTNKTAISELNLVGESLSDNHGFQVTMLTGQRVNAAGVQGALQAIAARQPQRLLVFVQTPVILSGTPSYHEVRFEAGSSLAHEAILAIVKDRCRHVVVVHDAGASLEVIASLDGATSRHIGISLTQGAFLVANTSRCWLYDGFATPIIAELLTQPEHPLLCAEDFVNGVLRSTNGYTELGSYTGDAALKAPFLFTVQDDEPEASPQPPSSPGKKQ